MTVAPRDGGICGAALVDDESEEGVVAGFSPNGNVGTISDQVIDRLRGFA